MSVRPLACCSPSCSARPAPGPRPRVRATASNRWTSRPGTRRARSITASPPRSGGVKIVQGTLNIDADRAVISFKDGEASQAVLTGNQAVLRQQMDNGTPMTARADRIDYDMLADVVVLTGNHTVTTQRGSTSGQRLTYNLKSGQVDSGGGTAAGQDAHPAQVPTDAELMLVAQGLRKRYKSREGGARFRPDPGCRRSGRPARPQRRRQDHLLLHDRRPGAGRRRPHRTARPRHHHRADVPARQARRRLPAAGTLGVPQAQRRRQPAPGAGIARRTWTAPAANANSPG